MSSLRKASLPAAIFPIAGLLLSIPVFALALYYSALPASAFEPSWVQNFRQTQLWSGLDQKAVSFGTVPQWSYFQVISPQGGPRLEVLNPVTNGYAYVDATAVGPSSAPPPAVPAAASPPAVPAAASPPAVAPLRSLPKLPEGYVPDWVSNFVETDLWPSPDNDAVSLGKLPQFRKLLVVEPQNGARLKVWNPERDDFAFVYAAAVGPSGPSVWTEARPPEVVRQVGLPGRSVGNKSYLRNLPAYADETEIRRLPNNSTISVLEVVTSSIDGNEWYRLEGNQYIRPEEARIPTTVASPRQGRWIDADLNEPAMLTAYEGNRVVYSAMAIKGVAATPTLRGTFQILYRVERETMDSATIGIPRDGPGGYLLKDVLYTQYFTNDGASLHYNYWLGTFGYAGSHGCLGLNLDDARWFWDWALVGTAVVVR